MDVSASARLKHVNSHIGASPVAHHGDGSVVGAVSFLSLLRLLASGSERRGAALAALHAPPPARALSPASLSGLSAAALRSPLSTLLLCPCSLSR